MGAAGAAGRGFFGAVYRAMRGTRARSLRAFCGEKRARHAGGEAGAPCGGGERERLRFIPKQSLSREDICILETL